MNPVYTSRRNLKENLSWNVKFLLFKTFSWLFQRGSLQQDPIPTKTRSRSVPDVMDTKFAAPLLAELLIKCRRLPRVFFWNRVLLPLVCSGRQPCRLLIQNVYCLYHEAKILACRWSLSVNSIISNTEKTNISFRK